MWKVKTSVMPPAANTYFCCAPRLCPVCVEAREAERKLLYRRALAAQHCPWDQGGQIRARAEREYQKAMMPESHAGIAPAPANCENSLKQKALNDAWLAERQAMEAEEERLGLPRGYISSKLNSEKAKEDRERYARIEAENYGRQQRAIAAYEGREYVPHAHSMNYNAPGLSAVERLRRADNFADRCAAGDTEALVKWDSEFGNGVYTAGLQGNCMLQERARINARRRRSSS